MRRAFTIVELVIAISLLALVAALALPAGLTLLTSEGRRAGLFACEGALRAAREHAMRQNEIVEVAAIEERGVWSMAMRPLRGRVDDSSPVRTPAAPAPEALAPGAGDDDDRPWETLATLPAEFAFRFEPLENEATLFEAPPISEAVIRGVTEAAEPERIAVVLPSGVVEAVDTWRLVTDRGGSKLVERLRVARWTGAITPEREVNDPYALDEEGASPPEPAAEAPPRIAP